MITSASQNSKYQEQYAKYFTLATGFKYYQGSRPLFKIHFLALR